MVNKGVTLKQLSTKALKNVEFGKNVKIFCESAIIKDGARIKDNVLIEAKHIEIGFDSIIDERTYIKNIKENMETFIIGDNCYIGPNNRFLLPYFSMNDYSQIHGFCLISGYKPLTLGYNCWVGQGAILNSYDSLEIGNNVRMGNSQIWTHVASGELLEGSRFFGSKPVTIEDDVWLMGFGHIISPGVSLAHKSVIMAGSVVTKSTYPMKTYSGIPAVDISEKLPAWKPMTLEEKVALIHVFINEFLTMYPNHKNNIHLLGETEPSPFLKNIEEHKDQKVIIVPKMNLASIKNYRQSIFDLFSKRYLKQRSLIEIDWMKFNLGYRARFLPYLDSQ